MGDFSKGGVHKTDGFWWMIFSKGGVHKTDGLWRASEFFFASKNWAFGAMLERNDRLLLSCWPFFHFYFQEMKLLNFSFSTGLSIAAIPSSFSYVYYTLKFYTEMKKKCHSLRTISRNMKFQKNFRPQNQMRKRNGYIHFSQKKGIM